MSGSDRTGLNVNAVQREVMIDHHFLNEIACTAGSKDRLERQDVLLFYGLSKSEYTEEMHEALLAKITRSDTTKISLWDDLIIPFRENRRHVRTADFNAGFRCEMQRAGIPTEPNAFSRYISDKAIANRESTKRFGFQDIAFYLPDEGFDSRDSRRLALGILKVMAKILKDVDRERAAEVQKFFTDRGCEGVKKYEDLLKIYLKDVGRTDIVSKRNTKFAQNIICYIKNISAVLSKFAVHMRTPEMRDRHRKKHKNVTRTNFDRMLTLQQYMEVARGLRSSRKPYVERVLIVGPGLETYNTELGIKLKRQSLEPYAVVDYLLQSGWSVFSDLKVDLLDINRKVVVNHYRDILDKARRGRGHELHCVSNKHGDFRSFGRGLSTLVLPDGERGAQIWGGKYGQTVVGVHPAVSSRMLPIEGNIITDHVAPDNSYDLVVILHTFMYFAPAEKALALENIARMMTSGGVLMTDSLPPSVVRRFDGCGESAKSKLKPLRMFGPFVPPIQIYVKD